MNKEKICENAAAHGQAGHDVHHAKSRDHTKPYDDNHHDHHSHEHSHGHADSGSHQHHHSEHKGLHHPHEHKHEHSHGHKDCGNHHDHHSEENDHSYSHEHTHGHTCSDNRQDHHSEGKDHNHSHEHSHGHTCSGSHHHDHNHSHKEDDSTEPDESTESDGSGQGHKGRSQFHVPSICCSSEIPGIKSIVEPMEGVSMVKVAVATKIVYVDHDVNVVSSSDISQALNSGGFSATVKMGAEDSLTVLSVPTDIFVKSTFLLQKQTDENAYTSMYNQVRTTLDAISSELDHIKSYDIDTANGLVIVEHNPYYLSAAMLVRMIKDGPQVCHLQPKPTQSDLQDISLEDAVDNSLLLTVKTDGAAQGMWALPHMQRKIEVEEDKGSIFSTIAFQRWMTALSGLFWVLSLLSYVGESWYFLRWFGVVSVAFGLPPIAIKSFRAVRKCRFDSHCMMFTAIIGALALQELPEAAALCFFFSISGILETITSTRARFALKAILDLRPELANLINPNTNEIIVVPAESVTKGSTVSIKPGDKVPCDGVVISGVSTVDESSLTGESRPVKKGVDDKVSGGTVNSGQSPITIRTTQSTENSAISRLVRLVDEAQTNRSETEALIDWFAKWYTPLILLLAALCASVSWAFGPDVGREWTENALVLIVVACPCALIISPSVAYVAGLAASAQKGVLVKGGGVLEALSWVSSISFDKTGTLTEGSFRCIHFNVIGSSHSREEVLAYTALMESNASHPLASALVAAAANEGVSVPAHLKVEDHAIIPGEGIKASVDSKECCLGNKKMFQHLGLHAHLSAQDVATTDAWAESGGTVVYISIGGTVAGAFCVSDKIRPEAHDVVTSLQKDQDISVVMLTGDHKDAAIAIGKQVGLDEDHIKSQLRPEDKLVYMTETVDANKTERGKCCLRLGQDNAMMVGDGVNDAPALALADVSVAMGNGAALAMETSDVMLMDSNLEKLLWVINMGKRTRRCIVQNVLFSLISKVIVVAITFVGSIGLQATLWAAIATDVGGGMVVTLNAMRLLPRNKDSIELTNESPPALHASINENTSGRRRLSRRASLAIKRESVQVRSSVNSIKIATNPELLAALMLSIRDANLEDCEEEHEDVLSAEERV